MLTTHCNTSMNGDYPNVARDTAISICAIISPLHSFFLPDNNSFIVFTRTISNHTIDQCRLSSLTITVDSLETFQTSSDGSSIRQGGGSISQPSTPAPSCCVAQLSTPGAGSYLSPLFTPMPPLSFAQLFTPGAPSQ